MSGLEYGGAEFKQDDGFPRGFVPLLERPASAELDSEMLAGITQDTIHSQFVQELDPARALVAVKARQGEKFIGVDIGGDKICSNFYLVGEDGKLHPQGDDRVLRSQEGAGYVNELEEIGEFSNSTGLPIGACSAGLFDGTIMKANINVPIFVEELAEQYGSDYAKILPNLKAIDNDAVAGLTFAALLLERTQPEIKDIIYIINGGGLGAAVLINGKLYATEGGHTKVVDSLNPFGRKAECGMFDQEFTCIEKIAASGAGIEPIWKEQTGRDLDGLGIEGEYKKGNELAAQLYDDSALLAAHLAVGLANSFGMDLKQTAIAGHGGGFKFPEYAGRIKQHLEPTLGFEPTVIKTHSFSPNACLEGAAALAVLAGDKS